MLMLVQVTDLLTFPQQHCPDVLVLGLLQINPPITLLRQESTNYPHNYHKNFILHDQKWPGMSFFSRF